MTDCPVLARAKIDKPHCDFPELCRLPTYCFWARFHQIDPQTGKPTSAEGEKQKELPLA